MVSPRELVQTIESALLRPAPTHPTQQIELLHAIRACLPLLKDLLKYPAPKASDRAQVQSKEVRLPDSSPISLDDMDVQIALKLSDELHLNEIECIRLLVSANREWVLLGREPLEIFRLAAGMWYAERRDIITSLYTLMQAVVLDQALEADFVADLQKYLADILESGLRQRIITLIKELNREEPTGFGGPNGEPYVLDFRGALLPRQSVVFRERLSLSHCLVLSVFITRIGPKDVKDVFIAIKDSADAFDESIVQTQIIFSLMFTLVIAFVSDALSLASDGISSLPDASSRLEIHELLMNTGNNPNVEGIVNVVRLAWTMHMIIVQDQSGRDSDLSNIYSIVQLVCSNNVFEFLLTKVLRTAAYQNDDEDLVYMYNGYMHKLMMFFLSHPLTKNKVKEMKEKAMSALSPYNISGSEDIRDGPVLYSQKEAMSSHPFISIMELVGEIYLKEPDLLYGNEDLWAFINFAGEDHTNICTVVAFLELLKTLASTEEGASKVFELLQGKMFRSIGWSTLFECISIYEDRFKQSLQSSTSILPEFPDGDAQALVAYLNVLQKVVENGNHIERKKWFTDIEPLFKLLSYENVPPYLKGALRNAIAAFIPVSPAMKDTIWSYLEQYDLPVVVGPSIGHAGQQMSSQLYDMRFELNEVEARSEKYPSTISFLNLINALIAEERVVSDRGRRFIGIFRFVYDHVFGPFSQRAYADPKEKWQLAIACLQHFHMVLSMYNIKDDDISLVDVSQSAKSHNPPLEAQLPAVELLKDFMSGKVIFRNIMSIILMGVDTVTVERTSQVYGPLLEKAVLLSLEIIILVLEKDYILADLWRPLYQPLDVILSQDQFQIVALLEYIRFEFQPRIQLCSIRIMSILSARMVELVPLLLKMNAAKSLIEDYATLLESRFDECINIENSKSDAGILIMQLLLDNINRPQPNISHLLLKFDMKDSIERTVLQPKYHFSCLKVILDNLEKVYKPEINALLYEFGFQLLHELCLDPSTSGPTMELLSSKRYQFFAKHLEGFIIAPLPKRSNNQALRISTLHQRAWLLKLLALELHSADIASSSHKETCLAILFQLFGQCRGPDASDAIDVDARHIGNRTMNNSKVLQLLEVVQFRSPDIVMYPQSVSNLNYDMVEEVLKNPTTTETGGIYYHSERGDRLIDLDAFHDKLLEICKQISVHLNEAERSELRDSIQQLLRWCWKYNKNLEEQAAQLHMLTGWSHIVEVSISRRMSFLIDRSQTLFEVLDASLSASASPDCSLKMAMILSNVALTCMAKLRDERFLCPGGVDSDSLTCVDLLSVKQLSNGACQSILFKLVFAILRNESSEILRRRQYALLLSYFQYCQSILDPDLPSSVLRLLLHEEQEIDDDMNLQKIDREQAELERANFSILRKESESIIDVVTRDATQGSEAGKAISLYVLDAFISVDQNRFILNQLQSKGVIRSCLTDISNIPYKDGKYSVESLQRMCTLEAQFLLLLRISHRYKKHGAQILLSMNVLEHIGSCGAVSLQFKGISRRGCPINVRETAGDDDNRSLLVTHMLRVVSSLTSLIDTSDFLEVKNKIVREVADFIKGHQSIFYQILKSDVYGADEAALERVHLVVSVLSKVWPYEENDEYGFVQELFSMINIFFQLDAGSSSFGLSPNSTGKQKLELMIFRLCFSLSTYLYFLVTKKQLRLQILDISGETSNFVLQQQPTLLSVVHLLSSITNALERAGEEKSLFLSKIQDINELSRQEVDEIITFCKRQEWILSNDNIRKRRYIAMIEMCHLAGNRDQLITVLLQLAERAFNILLIHFQEENLDSSDLSSLCEKLHPILERLEKLSEDKIGQALKLFQRSLSTVKEISFRYLAS